jgi:glycosyltransferase involved in cell wall biosynthesis
MPDRNLQRRLRIAYLTVRDPRDRRSWSGTLYSMLQALEKHCGEVVPIGPLLPFAFKWENLVSRGVHMLTGRTYLHTHTFSLSKKLGAMAEKKMSGEKFDVIFAPAASGILANLRTSLPIVYLSDTTLRLMLNYNIEFSNVLASHARMADQIERQSIGKASQLVYPSAWAANSAVGDYGADRSKVNVVPFGANLENPPSREQALKFRPQEPCRLLFVGVNWEQKGGGIAFEALLELQKFGIPAELTVVGCQPPSHINHPNLRVFPFLDKNDPDQRAELDRLYGEASFFILPTRSECFGIASCEANAYGLPVLSTATGGVPGVVREGVNGFLFPFQARGDQYAKQIRDIYNRPEACQALRISSRTEFETRLNWDRWGESLHQILQSAVQTARVPAMNSLGMN